jgi:signal transduction histidine kinase/DNA-binding response OmpR family regulator
MRARVMSGEPFSGFETKRTRKDGSFIDVGISTAPLYDAAGRSVGLVAVYADITERKRAEEQQRAREAAEAASRAKSQFLANMSHELRTPLNAIIGFSELMQEPAMGELNERQSRYVLNVLNSGRHLLQIVNDILDLAKIEAGRLVLDKVSFEVGPAIAEAHRLLEPLAAAKRLDFTLAVGKELPLLVADRAKLKQILYNLVSNAIKFTPEGGRVRTSVTRSTDGAPGVTIAVTDTGIGIKPEDQHRIFLEFEQVDGSYARHQQGTGLGLALTLRLVEAHDGRIWLESAPDWGTTFFVSLPSASPDGVATVPGETTPNGADGRPTVLVIEDDPTASRLVARYLGEAGFDVAFAKTAAEGIAAARQRRPVAITLDVLLPDQDGLELLAQLRADPETKDIPVVVVSVTSNRELGFSLGAAEWLEKPIDGARLVEAVRRALPGAGISLPTVLVIDDNSQMVELLDAVLHNHGCRVLRAYDGATGVETAIAHQPQVIVLDLLMPGLSGFDVVQRLRQNPRTEQIPILISTVKDLTAEDQQRLQGQVRSIVSKSGPDHLVRVLQGLGLVQGGAIA